MIYGGAFASSHIPHERQCNANIQRHSFKTSSVGADPTISTTTGGFLAISRIGPISLSLQYMAPRRSRFIQQNIKNSVKPGSIFGIAMSAPIHAPRRWELSAKISGITRGSISNIYPLCAPHEQLAVVA